MIGAITFATAVLVIGAIGFAFRRRVAAGREAARHVVLRRDAEGVIVVPVAGLSKDGASVKNSINPFFAIAPEGLRFKVLFGEAWSFADLKMVRLHKGIFGPRLSFTCYSRGVLEAQFWGPEVPRQVLAALPASVPLCPKAIAFRDIREQADNA
jgi:hypothetical protein